MMRRAAVSAAFLLLVMLLGGCDRPAPAPPEPARAHHVLIVSIDGCRPDVLLRSQMELVAQGKKPAIRELMSEGSFTFWAQTIPASITLPSHTSMLTGTPEETHGITWNTEMAENAIIYPKVPTLFEVAKTHGLTTSIFAGKEKFFTLARPGAIDWGYINKKGSWLDDVSIAAVAGEVIRQHKPNVVFLHLSHSDVVGHGSDLESMREDQGWGSPAQIASLQEADLCVGIVVKGLKDAGIYNDTLTIITADHGGAGYSHGPDDPRSRHIPWICVGPQVKQNWDLTRNRDLTVHTEDTFATACYFLGLPMGAEVTGRPVKEVIADRELLEGAP